VKTRPGGKIPVVSNATTGTGRASARSFATERTSLSACARRQGWRADVAPELERRDRSSKVSIKCGPTDAS
jgi:NADP-dependent 3-hydroxy acid dehydrogenase YdfG